MKILVTGGSGALGKALKKRFPDASFPTHAEMDITDAEAVNKVILAEKPDVVIHTAAMVSVRDCEERKQDAWKTNVEGTQNIVNALKQLDNNCYLMYVSTACAFAGEQKKFYTEEDVPAPKNFYSFSKVVGEIVTKQHPHTVIIRTNFAPKEQWKYPKAFTDRFGTYLFPEQVTQGIKDVLDKKETGIIHIVGKKRISMFELATLAGSEDIGEMTLADYSGPPVTVDMSLGTKRWHAYEIQ